MRIYKFILLGLCAIGLARAAALPASDAVTPGISQADVLKLPPNVVTRRAVAQIAEYLAAPIAGAYGAQEQNFARAGIARILASGQDAQVPPDITSPPMRERLAMLLTLIPQDSDPASLPRQLQALSFKTRLHAAAISNLCVADELTSYFSPLGDARGPEAPMKVVLVYVTSWYYFLSPPLGAMLPKMKTSEREKADFDCAKLEGHRIDAFIATDEDQATRGYWLQQAMQKQLRSGNITFDVNCGTDQQPAECRKKLQDALSGRPQVVRCQNGDADCKLFFSDHGLTLDITASEGPHPVIARVLMETIARVRVQTVLPMSVHP